MYRFRNKKTWCSHISIVIFYRYINLFSFFSKKVIFLFLHFRKTFTLLKHIVLLSLQYGQHIHNCKLMRSFISVLYKGFVVSFVIPIYMSGTPDVQTLLVTWLNSTWISLLSCPLTETKDGNLFRWDIFNIIKTWVKYKYISKIFCFKILNVFFYFKNKKKHIYTNY